MLEVPQEFIDEGKLCKVVQKNPNAPYSKKDRLARRKEVYRLHFELGWPAVRIADTMKIHRNTINDDIKHWYSKFVDQLNEYGYTALIQKHIIRAESQRTRLLEMLEKENDSDRKLSIERMIMDSESRLSNITFKAFDTDYSRNVLAIALANTKFREAGSDTRYYSAWEATLLSKEKREEINKILWGKK